MPNWKNISAWPTALVCALVIASSIQLAAGESELYEILKSKQTRQDVKRALGEAPNNWEVVCHGLTVGFLKDMSNPTVRLCEPGEISNIMSLLERTENRGSMRGLYDYVKYYYRKMIPLCVGGYFKHLVDKMRAHVLGHKSALEDYLSEGAEHLMTDDKIVLEGACEYVCTAVEYVRHMNFYKKVIFNRNRALGELAKYQDACSHLVAGCHY